MLTREKKRQGLADWSYCAIRLRTMLLSSRLLERKERTPTVQVALQLAAALGAELSEMLARAEAIASGKTAESARSIKKRTAQKRHFHNESELMRLTGLSHECIRHAIQGCYQTLDTVDFQLKAHNSPPFARLVELANISSMIGNLLGGQIAACSNGLYIRNAERESLPENGGRRVQKSLRSDAGFRWLEEGGQAG